MRLIPDAGKTLFRSYSQWGNYLGISCLILPPIIALAGVETDPYLIGMAALLFFVYGTLGRVIDQTKSGRVAKLLFGTVMALGLVLFGKAIITGVFELQTLPPPAVEGAYGPDPVVLAMDGWPQQVTPPNPPENAAQLGIASEADFLAIAVPFVGKWEGLRLMAYQDVVGVWTVCYGETKGILPGMTFTKRQCDDMFSRELLAYRWGVHKAMTDETLATRLPVYRDVAYSSLGYNVGLGAVSNSTAVRRLNSGDIAGGCVAITWYNKAGGKVWRGLKLRRSEEETFCMIGVVA
jgi:GH24 family phage-related lysozyme (muramidase)